jgi:CelD/BcsL family acetyltransferase involved in cellulose biosynthesis
LSASKGTVVRTADGLRELTPGWERLYQESATRNPFLNAEWTQGYLETLGRQTDLFIVAVHAEGRLVGLAPLCIERRAGFRVLRFITEDRSDYLGFLCTRDHETAGQELIDTILDQGDEWDLALLKRLAPEYSGLAGVQFPSTVRTRGTVGTTARYTAADVDWEQLHEIGPSWLKRTRKRLPRFLRDGWLLERFTGTEAAARLDLVAQVEARSWKARENVMRLQPGAGQELLRRALETLGTRGEMQLWMASLDGRAAAYRIDFVLPDKVWIYQLGYDQEFHRASVGSFLGYVALEQAWRSGAREYDYLSGDEPYKAERTMASREIRDLAFYRRTVQGRAAFALLLAPRWYLREVPLLRSAFRSARSLVSALGNRG